MRYAFVGVLLLGALLRVLWVEDMEYKADEIYMYEKSQTVGVTESWPWVGMPSGVGLPNPGLSVWVFVILAKVGFVDSPTGLAQAVRILNILALLIWVLIVIRLIPRHEWEKWFWALSLMAVNPFAVLLERKIWAQSVLPFFAALFFLGWLKRRHRGGAFLWGLVGASLGQIHLSGFFFSAGFLLWTALLKKGARWGFWVLGSFIGALPLIPWYLAVSGSQSGSGRLIAFHQLIQLQYVQAWIKDAGGLGLRYSLGPHFSDFLAFPLSTYLVTILHFLIGGILVFTVLHGLHLAWRNRFQFLKSIKAQDSESKSATHASFFSFGLLLSLIPSKIHRHYLIIAYPFQWLWLATWALLLKKARIILSVLVVSQALLTLLYLIYLHQECGAPGGDYGIAFRCQSLDQSQN